VNPFIARLYNDQKPGYLGPFHLFNIVLAVLSVVVLLFVHLFGNAARESALAAMAVIFVAGAMLGQVAERKLMRVDARPEIERLIVDAEGVLKDLQPATATDLSATISWISLSGALLCWVVGLAIAILPADPAGRYWSAVVAVLVGEAIYLSCCFERSAKKSELEALALDWKTKSAERPDIKLGSPWATRAIELADALGQPRKKKPELT
jgi:hypothetical protein